MVLTSCVEENIPFHRRRVLVSELWVFLFGILIDEHK